MKTDMEAGYNGGPRTKLEIPHDSIDNESKPECEHLLKVSEAANCLGVSVRTFYRLVDLGEFPQVVKIGRISRIPSSDVQAYIDRLKDKRDRKRGAR